MQQDCIADDGDPDGSSHKSPLASRGMVSAESEHGVPVQVEPATVQGARALSRRREEETTNGGSTHSSTATSWAPKLVPGTKAYQAYLSWLTLGIVYGDIGTSPLYTFSTIFASGPPVESDVVGALSCMIWTLVLLTGFKYLTLVLMADDHGEGGTFAIYALLSRGLRARITDDKLFNRLNTGLAILALVGVSMVLSDGILTPAISVLGAIAGMEIIAPDAASAVIPVSCVILVLLFLVQYRGTERVSFMFSPIITIWFFANVAINLYNITLAPQVLAAFSPSYAFEYFINDGYNSWVSLGAIFLTVTGSEAMFADMGHFNANAMRMSAFCFVLPSLLITYCGQAAAIVANPSIVSNTFYLSMPNWALIPMLVLATLAAIIASQAMISASFSIISQAIRLQCFPRMTVKQTGKYQMGQVYIPEVNYFYMVMVVIVVAAYQNSTALGYAYGVAVSSVFLITSFYYTWVIIVNFKRHWFWALLFFCFFGTIEVAYLSANLLKFATGGFFAIVLSVIITFILTVWRWGRLRMVKRQAEMSVNEDALFQVVQQTSMDDFVQFAGQAPTKRIMPHTLTPTACKVTVVPQSVMMCFSSTSDQIPSAYVHFLRRLPARSQYLVFVTVCAVNVPYVQSNMTLVPILDYEHVYRVVFNYGYAESPPDACALAIRIMLQINRLSQVGGERGTANQVMMEPTFMMGLDSVVAEPDSSTVHQVLVECFKVLLLTSRQPATTLNIPPHMVLQVGLLVPI